MIGGCLHNEVRISKLPRKIILKHKVISGLKANFIGAHNVFYTNFALYYALCQIHYHKWENLLVLVFIRDSRGLN